MVPEPFMKARSLMDCASKEYDLSKAAECAKAGASSEPDAKYLLALFQYLGE